MPATASPRASSARQAWAPMKPAAPVTSTRIRHLPAPVGEPRGRCPLPRPQRPGALQLPGYEETPRSQPWMAPALAVAGDGDRQRWMRASPLAAGAREDAFELVEAVVVHHQLAAAAAAVLHRDAGVERLRQLALEHGDVGIGRLARGLRRRLGAL